MINIGVPSGHARFRRHPSTRTTTSWRTRAAALGGAAGLVVGVIAFSGGQPASAATNYVVAAQIPIGSGPNNSFSVGVDPATGTVYAPNFGDGTVSVISETTDTVTDTIALGAGVDPLGVAVDPTTDTVYVAGGGEVTVINGGTNTVTGTIADFNDPDGMAVDSATGTLYVANNGDGSLWAINEATDTVTSMLPLGVGDVEPTGVAVDPTTDTVYVSGDSNTVWVVSGATDTVTTTVTVGSSPFGIGLDAATGTVYVANLSGSVSVISEATNTVTATVPVAGGPFGLGVDSATDVVYTADVFNSTVSVIDGSTDTVAATVSVGSSNSPEAVAVDASTDSAFVSDALVKGATDPNPDNERTLSVIAPLATLAVTVTGSQTYGSSSPTFSTTATAPAGDTLSGSLTCTSVVSPETSISSSLPAGSYTLDGSTCSGLALSGPSAAGYQIVYTGGTFSVTKAATGIVNQPVDILTSLLKLSVTFSATLTTPPGGSALAGQTVVFSSGTTAECSAVTNSHGVATCSTGILGLLPILVKGTTTATFAGTSNYQGSAATTAYKLL